MGIDSSLLITLEDWESVPKPEQLFALVKNLIFKKIVDFDCFVETYTSQHEVQHGIFAACLTSDAREELIDDILKSCYDEASKTFKAWRLHLTSAFRHEMNEALQTTQVISEILVRSSFELTETTGITYEILFYSADNQFAESLRKLMQEGLVRIRIYKNYTDHTGKVSIVKKKDEEFFVDPSEADNYTIYDEEDHEGIEAAYERGDEIIYLTDTGCCYVFDMKGDYRRIDFDINELDFKIFGERNEHNEDIYTAVAYEGAFAIGLSLRNDVVSPEKYWLFLASEPCRKLVACVERAFGQPAYVTSDFSRF